MGVIVYGCGVGEKLEIFFLWLIFEEDWMVKELLAFRQVYRPDQAEKGPTMVPLPTRIYHSVELVQWFRYVPRETFWSDLTLSSVGFARTTYCSSRLS